MMTFEQHLAQVEAVANFDAWMWEETEAQMAELRAAEAVERWYEGGCGSLQLQEENRRDLAEFDSQFPNGYCS